MINALNLLWIVPLAAAFGYCVCAILIIVECDDGRKK